MGPQGLLTHNKVNPRWFADQTGKGVLLTGFHSWNNLVDMGPAGKDNPFDYGRYLDDLTRLGHSFIRLWAWDALSTWNPDDRVGLFPWPRTGPGLAVDGLPKFDLSKHNEEYFARLRERVQLAADRDLYVGVMLFDAWSARISCSTPKDWMVFAGGNNVNGIDVAANQADDWLLDWVTLSSPETLAFQKKYVAKVVETLNDMPNVIYEVANEAGRLSYGWQEHIVAYVHELERDMPFQHLIGVTGGNGTKDDAFFRIKADYLAPEGWANPGEPAPYMNGEQHWGEGQELGKTPMLLDTDHIWGIGGRVDWAWKSVLCGYHALYMDRLDDYPTAFYEHEWWPNKTDPEIRLALGAIQRTLRGVDLNCLLPDRTRTSSGWALGSETIVVCWAPAKEALTVNTGRGRWRFSVIHPVTGESVRNWAEDVEETSILIPAQDQDVAVIAVTC